MVISYFLFALAGFTLGFIPNLLMGLLKQRDTVLNKIPVGPAAAIAAYIMTLRSFDFQVENIAVPHRWGLGIIMIITSIVGYVLCYKLLMRLADSSGD